MTDINQTPQFRAVARILQRSTSGTRWRDDLRGTNFQRFLLDA